MEWKKRSPRARVEIGRHARRTLYMVAGFYVVVGFVVATASAVGGDRLGTFLGFLIISGAIGGTFVLKAVLNMETGVSALGEAVLDARDRLGQLERSVSALREQVQTGDAPVVDRGVRRLLDLAAIGNGDPSALTAATLDRAVFPRLVAAMDGEPPAQSQPAGEAAKADAPPPSDGPADGEGNGADVNAGNWHGPSSINLLRQWKIALRDGDLGSCKAVYSAMIDTAGEEAARPLRAQIEELGDRVERSLREALAARIRAKQFAEALAIGERLCHLLPDRPAAAEFQRLEPHLRRRLRPPQVEPISSIAP